MVEDGKQQHPRPSEPPFNNDFSANFTIQGRWTLLFLVVHPDICFYPTNRISVYGEVDSLF